MMETAKCLVFDLDGTLYEDTDHFDYYARLLKECVDDQKQEDFQKDYERAQEGSHPVQIGKVYDAERDVVLTVNPFSFIVEQVEEWSGNAWTDRRVRTTYLEPVHLNFHSMIALGDGWWPPFSIALHYGVTRAEAYDCYVKTKDYMSSGQFEMTKTKGLREALLQWREEKRLVLLTNSEAYDVKNILKNLDLEGVFHEVIPSANKPEKTDQWFEQILDNWEGEASEIVSIGDNFMNEIAPALQYGFQAVFIQSHDIRYDHPHLKVVNTLSEMTEINSKTPGGH
ncbi:HAD family hydrolase [Halobacillus fulvus]|nr:HAD family hydrolase [Halobacillus fulvus]